MSLMCLSDFGVLCALMKNPMMKGSLFSRWQKLRKLRSAIEKGDYKGLDELLKQTGRQCQMMRVNSDNDTLLMLAVRLYDVTGLRLLLRHNAVNPNIANKHGLTALDVALLKRSEDRDNDEILRPLAVISYHVTLDVMTTVLNADCLGEERVCNTVALLAGFSRNLSVRAKLFYTMLSQCEHLLPEVLKHHNADPSGITDRRLNTRRLLSEVIGLHFFKASTTFSSLFSDSHLLLLIQAANSPEAMDFLTELLLGKRKDATRPAAPADGEEVGMNLIQHSLTLIISSGHRMSEENKDWLASAYPDLYARYEAACKKPDSLLSLARKGVRSSLETNTLYGSQQLPIPVVLQRYLCFQ